MLFSNVYLTDMRWVRSGKPSVVLAGCPHKRAYSCRQVDILPQAIGRLGLFAYVPYFLFFFHTSCWMELLGDLAAGVCQWPCDANGMDSEQRMGKHE